MFNEVVEERWKTAAKGDLAGENAAPIATADKRRNRNPIMIILLRKIRRHFAAEKFKRDDKDKLIQGKNSFQRWQTTC